MAETTTQEKQESKIILPKTPSPPLYSAPRTAIWYGLPKCGKTTMLSKLPNHIIVDIEAGSGHVTANRIMPPEDLGPVGIWKWLKQVVQAIIDEGRLYDHVIFETISYLDELSEWVGTRNYMESPQGKKFNRDATGKPYKFGSSEYSSVHEIGEGYGYRWSREAMMDIFDITKGLGKVCTHYTCHVLDKMISSKTGNDTGQIRVMDLSLTGRLKTIIPRDVDAIGYMYQKNGTLNVSFKGSEERTGGIRGENSPLQGYDGPLDWNQIFKKQ
jgi:hypothetical protein